MRCVSLLPLPVLLLGILAVGPASGSAQSVPAGSTQLTSVDLTRLPVGDGRISSAPELGSVWACTSRFAGGGAQATGDWFRDDGTFDFTGKPTVDGEVLWPSQFSVTREGDLRRVEGNDLPDHPTGTYPVSSSDDAYRFDRNPNAIREQAVLYLLPAEPVASTTPTCLAMGPVGVLLTGSYVFNALDARGLDAVAHEIQDGCQGHPERNGAYHYHSLTTCGEDGDTGHSALLGYALDGFGIFGHRGEDGITLTNADLDACHGHTHEIPWDGEVRDLYHYHATWEYPYLMGCFRGAPVGPSAPGAPPTASLSVITLGTGSPVYNPERAGASTAIRAADRTFLVDMGNGTQARMSEAGIALRDVDALLVTHHHRDHDEELIPLVLLASLQGAPLIAGPPGTDRLVRFALDFWAEDLAYRAGNRGRSTGAIALGATDLVGGESFDLTGVQVSTTQVNHSIHTLAYRFDAGEEAIVVSGDLGYSESLVSLAMGSDVLVIDSGSLRVPLGPRAELEGRAHANLVEVATMARDSGTRCLVLTHFTRDDYDEATVRQQIGAVYPGRVIFAEDRMEITSTCTVNPG